MSEKDMQSKQLKAFQITILAILEFFLITNFGCALISGQTSKELANDTAFKI